MQIIILNLIGIFSLVGFCIAYYLYSKKKAKTKLICPMRSDCDTVIHSDYSRIVGIPVEILGMIYYAFIGCIYPFLFVIHMYTEERGIIILGISLSACLFSFYLISIQAFIVKHWCSWCLFSACISILIAVLSYFHLTLF